MLDCIRVLNRAPIYGMVHVRTAHSIAHRSDVRLTIKL